MYAFAQVMIFLFSVGGIWLLMLNNKWSKWGPVVSILGQPFWFYSTLTDEAWGIFFSAILYTFFFAMGIYNFWIRKK